MILMKQFPLGRLANNLFQIAFILALSKRTKTKWKLPKWKYEKYFNFKWNLDEVVEVDKIIKCHGFDFNEIVLNYKSYKSTSFEGYFQSEKYFEDVWDDIKDQFKFEQKFLDSIFERTEFRPKKNDFAVHVRLGDYLNNSNYINITPFYYKSLFRENNKKYYIFTDDHELCQKMIGRHENVEYIEGNSDIEDMALMSQFKNIFIANSSFSWWAAKIAEIYNKNVNIIRPDCLLSGELAKLYHGNDFYPKRWKIRSLYPKIKNSKNRINLKDVTFVIPVKYDHVDRMENLNLVILFLRKYFDTNIIIGEQGGCNFRYLTSDEIKYYQFKDIPFFYRTKIINELVKLSNTSIVFNWDADVIVDPLQIIDSVSKLRKEDDFVYPYDGTFVHVGREFVDDIESCINNDEISSFNYLSLSSQNSKGGAIGFRKDSFISAGMENESFERYGFEDNERYERYLKLGYKICFTEGVLLHIEHFKGKDSTVRHSKIPINKYELRKISEMTRLELKSYIQTWGWAKF